MKLDTEAISLELRKLDGGFVQSLRKGFDGLSNIRDCISKDGITMNERHGVIKEKGVQALSALKEIASHVRGSVEETPDANLKYLSEHDARRKSDKKRDAKGEDRDGRARS